MNYLAFFIIVTFAFLIVSAFGKKPDTFTVGLVQIASGLASLALAFWVLF
jgi:hypothetical protein